MTETSNYSSPTLPQLSLDSGDACSGQSGANNQHRHGRFLVLRAHARGGLGEVSLAMDESLHRKVALKQIRSDLADNPATRHRFLREAEITGQLEHPSIVPVYALGQDQDGHPYYAMRFVEGRTFEEVIGAYHAKPDQIGFHDLLRRFLDICRAVAYAHSQSIIHRDLKPANVMVGKYGETLILDWGLARRMYAPADHTDHSPIDAEPLPRLSAVTQAGQLVGTPAYMAPEQWNGAPDVGPAADIYSLGAILFQILTGEPPHAGPSSATETFYSRHRRSLKNLRKGRTIPGALKAICLKALQPKAPQRYASAAALASDIEHWLADEPVEAYREPLSSRALRWSRRHKVTVASACILLITAVVALSISNIVITRARSREAAALKEKDVALTRANTEKAKATAIAELLQNAISSANPDSAKGTEYTVRELLDQLSVRFGKQLADQPEAEAEIRTTLGRAYGGLNMEEYAEREFGRALELYRRLYGPEHDQFAGALLNYAQVISRQHGILAEAYMRDVLRIYRRNNVLDGRYREALSALHWHLCHTRRFVEALALTEQALQVYRIADPYDPRRSGAMGYQSWMKLRMGEPAEAEELARLTLEIHRRSSGSDRPGVAWTYGHLVDALRVQNKLDEAEPIAREAVALFRQHFGINHHGTLTALEHLRAILKAKGDTAGLVALELELSRPAQKSDRAQAHLWLARGHFYVKIGQWRQAFAAFESAGKAATDDDPALREAVGTASLYCADRAIGHRDRHPDLEVTQNAARLALRMVGSATANAPTEQNLLVQGRGHRQLAFIAQTKEQYGDAGHSCRSAIEAFARGTAVFRENRLFPLEQALTRRMLAEIVGKGQRLDEVISQLRIAQKLLAELTRAYPEHSLYEQERSNTLVALVDALMRADQQQEAASLYAEAAQAIPDTATGWITRARLHAAAREWSHASADSIQAFQIAPDDGRVLIALRELAERLRANNRATEAAALYRHAIVHCQSQRQSRAYFQQIALRLYSLLYSFLRSDDRASEAAETLQSAIRLRDPQAAAPAAAYVCNAMSWQLAMDRYVELRDPIAAVTLARRAVELEPQAGHIWNTLGVAHHRAGQHAPAVDALHKAMHLRAGGDSFDHFFLAMAYQEMKRADDARQWYAKGVEWMDKNQPTHQGLRNLRAEAESVLNITSSRPTTPPH